KVVCLFFSANWCRPSKSFAPQLVQLYHSLKSNGNLLEIIFVSLDRDEEAFKEHFICGIPVEQDLIGYIEDYGADAFPFTRNRIEELKAIDEAKRQGGNLEQLLAHTGRNFLLSRESQKVSVSQLDGKTIGLYFGAHWCPPSRSFTAQLVEAYSELKATTIDGSTFEVVFISTDRDIKEFNISLSNMPWLAIPYEDRTRQDLCRIFNIKGIPALVLIGEDGKIMSTEGKSMISLYGAKAFPFTESRVSEIQAALRKEGEALPKQVKDKKHGHVLKLDMAKAYVCDCCKMQGRFWAFSCHVCDYDLHPACVENVAP
ncbi:Probable nucleoredoxin 3, partial [Linum perenne]